MDPQQLPELQTVGDVCIYAITDVHTSIPKNLEWLKEIVGRRKEEREKERTSILLVAGDVAESLEKIRETLLLCKEAFTEVFFTPGNHDLWLSNQEQGTTNSLSKLHSLISLCSSIGVHTSPLLISTEGGGGKFWVVPILSWHHASFDTEKDIPKEEAIIPDHRMLFQDFRRCTWPPPLDDSTDGVASHLDQLNPSPLFQTISSSRYPTISFSHFLPHLSLLPEKRYLFFPHLAKAVGSDYLRERVRRLGPVIHVFGHTHFGWDMKIEGTRFIQAPLGYPTERKSRGKSLYVGKEDLWKDSGIGEREDLPPFPEPLKIYDSRGRWGEKEEGNVFVPRLWAHWSSCYDERERDPENTVLAPWVRERWSK